MTIHIPHYIGGEIKESRGQSISVFNPNNGEEIGYIHCADLQLIRLAIAEASKVQPQWADTPALKRAKILRNFAQLLEQGESILAELVSLEHGKTLSDAKASIQRGLELVNYHTNIAQQLQGQFRIKSVMMFIASPSIKL